MPDFRIANIQLKTMSNFQKSLKNNILSPVFMKLNLWAIIAASFCFQVNQLKAQSNPGFMGKTQLIDFYVLSDWGGLISSDPKINLSYGLQYEVARKRNFGISVGIRGSQLKYKATGYEPGFSMPTPNGDYMDVEVKSASEGNPEMDYLKYNANELFIQFKRYRTTKGGLAPYGSYWGLELSGAQFTPTENKIRYRTYNWMTGYDDININVPKESVMALIPSIIFGKRTMLTDEVSLNYFGSIGTVFFHNSNADVFYGSATNASEVIQYIMINELSISRLFSVGVSVGYLF